MNTQLPGCIPATLHCTPIEPCPTINPPCHGGGYQAGGYQAGGYQAGPQTHVQHTNCPPMTVCPQPTTLCPPPQPQAGGANYTPATVCTQIGCHTHVQATSCPPATVCPQPTTLCGPQPQQAGGTIHPTIWTQPFGLCPPPQYPQAGGTNYTPATVCTQYGCHTHVHATSCPPATVCPQPTTLCGPQPQQAGGANFIPATGWPNCACPGTASALLTQINCAAQAQPGPTPTATFYPGCGHTCLPYTVLPVTFPPGCQG